MEPRTFLRLEGLAVFALAVAAYFWLGGPLWLFLLLALAPDLSMLGYLAGPVVGSRTYNLVHTYVGPVGLAAVGVLQGVELAILVGLVWTAHIGADRALTYGLKYPSGFKDTHLGRLPGRGSETAPAPEPAD
jgi:hypothetical protein